MAGAQRKDAPDEGVPFWRSGHSAEAWNPAPIPKSVSLEDRFCEVSACSRSSTPRRFAAGGSAMEGEILHMLGKLTDGQERLEAELLELCSGQKFVTGLLNSLHSSMKHASCNVEPAQPVCLSEQSRLSEAGQAWLQDELPNSRPLAEEHPQNFRVVGSGHSVELRPSCLSSLMHKNVFADLRISSPFDDRRAEVHGRGRAPAKQPPPQERKSTMEREASWTSNPSITDRRISKTDGGLRAAVAASLGLEGGWPKNVRIREQLCGQGGAIQSHIDSRHSYLFDRTTTFDAEMSDLPDPGGWAASTTSSTISMDIANHKAVMRKKWSLILEPSSTVRLFIDLISLFVLIYDMTVTPWILAWSVPFAGFVKIGTFFTLAFWCVDMSLSFRTGFYKMGELEMRPGPIAHKYLRTFFLPDLLIIITDMANIALNYIEEDSANIHYSSEGMRVLRLVKAGRFLRILGVVRLGHCMEVLSRINDRHTLWGDTTYFLGEVALLIMTILWLNHVVGCIWYLLGNGDGGDTGFSWLDQPISPTDSETYRTAGFVYQYMTSFHWSVTQMTPGSMQVSPVNSAEREFNIVCLIFGMLIFGTLVSSLSAKMMHVKMAMQESNKRMVTLRRFLRSSGVSPQLAVSIQKQAIERQKLSKKPLTVAEVSLLGLLSLSMRTELMWELCRPHLLRHPIFRLFEIVDPFATKKICREAIDFVVLSPGDTLFQPGGEAQAAFFVVSGTLRYLQDPGSSPVRQCVDKEVTPGMRLCEATLWSVWTHVGTAEAVNVCQLMCVNVKKFIAVLSGRTLIQEVAYEYALEYHKRLTACSREEYWPSDLEVPFTQFDEIMISIRGVVQVFVGLMTIRMASRIGINSVVRRWSRNDRGLAELEEEVRMRRCIVLVNGAGEVQRVTAVTVVKMYDADGERFLAQLGKVDFGRVEANCMLPGMKVDEGGEMNINSLNRLLRKRLAPFAPLVVPHTHSSLTEVHEEESRSCGFQTKYIKTIHTVTINDGFDPAALGLDVITGNLTNITLNRSGTENMSSAPNFVHRFLPSFVSLARVLFSSGFEEAPKMRNPLNPFRRCSYDISELPSMLDVYFLRDNGDKGTQFSGDGLRPAANGDAEGFSPSGHAPSEKGSTVYLYAWLKPREFDFFTTPDGHDILKNLISSLEVDEDYVQRVPHSAPAEFAPMPRESCEELAGVSGEKGRKTVHFEEAHDPADYQPASRWHFRDQGRTRATDLVVREEKRRGPGVQPLDSFQASPWGFLSRFSNAPRAPALSH